MLYLLSAAEIRRLAKGTLRPKDVIIFRNQALFSYSGEDIQQQAHRACKEDVFDTIAEATCMHACLGECLADEISSRVMEDKFEDPDR